MIEFDAPEQLVSCDGCKKKLCLLVDYGWQTIGCAFQDSNGVKHFCSTKCLMDWLAFEKGVEK